MFVYFSEFDFSTIFEAFIPFLDGVNNFFYNLFKNGNYVFFFLFLIMSIVLLINAREIEYGEMLHTHQPEMIKKRGRTGMAIYFILAFAFLSKDLLKSLYGLFKILPEPAIILGFMSDFSSVSLSDVPSLDIGFISLFFFISFLSLISLLFIIIGLYLMFFNKFILQSKLKFMVFIGAGFILWIFFGFRTSLRLMV